jgi:hypothetical protein
MDAMISEKGSRLPTHERNSAKGRGLALAALQEWWPQWGKSVGGKHESLQVATTRVGRDKERRAMGRLGSTTRKVRNEAEFENKSNVQCTPALYTRVRTSSGQTGASSDPGPD